MAHYSESSAAGMPDDLVGARVIDAAGNAASIVSIQQGGGDSTTGMQAWVRLDEGMQVLVPVTLLAHEAGVYRLPFAFRPSREPRQPAQMTFPVIEEDVQVARRSVDTGRGVRVHKTVTQREEVVDQPLRRDRLEVEHVPVGRVVSEAEAQTRYEGDTLVVPVVEEVLVVQKQLLLKEEVRITRRSEEIREPQTVTLRAEQIHVERFDDGRAPSR